MTQARGEASKGKWADPVIRRRIVEGQRRYWEKVRANPELLAERGRAAKNALADPEVRRRISEGTKQGLANPEAQKRLRDGIRAAWAADPERRKRASERATRVFSDPEIEEKRRLAHDTPEARQRISEGNRRSYASNPERGRKVGEWATKLWEERKARLAEAERILAEQRVPNWENMTDDQKIAGSYLVVAPRQVSNKELATAMGREDNRAFEMFAFRVRKLVGKPGKQGRA